MTDVILSSFISLFALFGKEEQVDETRAKEMLVSYLRHHFGIRNIDLYLDLYSDMRMAYEMTDDLNSEETVNSICSTLHGKIRRNEEALLLLRLMEFCSDDGLQAVTMFDTMARQFHIPDNSLPCLLLGLLLALLIVGVCLLVSRIIRLSPFLGHWLFGVKYEKQ